MVFGCPGNRWWMKGAHTKARRPVAAAGDRELSSIRVLFRSPQNLPSFVLVFPDWTPAGAQLLVSLPHLLLRAAATETANHVCARSVQVQRATVIPFLRA